MSVRRSLAWMILSQGGNFVLQFGSTVVLARLLTPYDMGIYAAAMAVVGILSVFQAFGVALFVIREPHQDGNMLATAFTLNAIISVLLTLAIAGLSALGGAFLREPGVQRVMLLLAPIPLLSIPQFLPATIMEKSGNFRAIALVNLSRVVVGTSLTVVLAFADVGYASLAWGTLAGAGASCVAFMIAGRQHLSFRVGLRAWRRITTFCLQQFAIQGVNEIAGRLSEFMLGRIVGLAGLGLYGRAVSLNSAIWTNIHLVVGRVVLVDFAEKYRRGESLQEAYLRTLDLTTAILWPAFLGLAVLAGPMTRIIYGDNWVAAGPPLAALSLAAVLLVSITMTWELFAVCQQAHKQAKLEVVRAGIGTVLFIGGCFAGLTAAALARVGEAAFSVMLYRPYVEGMTHTRFADFASIYRRNGVLTLLACGPSIVLMAISGWSPFVPFGYVASTVTLGVLAWVISLKVMGHVLADELDRVLSKLRVGRRLGSLKRS